MNQLTTTIRSQQWLQVIRDQKESGITIEAWCCANNINKHAFYYRQHNLREQAGEMLSLFVEDKAPQLSDQTSLEIRRIVCKGGMIRLIKLLN